MAAPILSVENFAQLRKVGVTFGDLTVFVGPQATGKSMVLQLLKLAVDSSRIAGTLRDRGFGWSSRSDFCAVYFGEACPRLGPTRPPFGFWAARCSLHPRGLRVILAASSTFRPTEHSAWLKAGRRGSAATSPMRPWLMERGYRVAISTHSPTIVELVWALGQLKEKRASAGKLREIFGLDRARWDIDRLAGRTLRRDFRVFYLDFEEGRVASRDISGLDPGAADFAERTWGELLAQSVRANAAVADAESGAE